MSGRRIVLFDIDGTLLRGAGPHHKEALIEAAWSVMDVRCTLEGVDTAGKMDRDLLLRMLLNAGAPQRKVISGMTKMVEAAQHHYVSRAKIDLSYRLCPGVKSLLELLSAQGIPIGLVTGNLSAIAWRKLENAGIDKHFVFGAFAEQATTRARLAKMAINQAKRKNLAAASCLVTLIGDHASDVEAAKLNGFRSLAVATGTLSANELRKLNADVVLDNLEGATLDVICGKWKRGAV